jgi:hypothetical protein
MTRKKSKRPAPPISHADQPRPVSPVLSWALAVLVFVCFVAIVWLTLAGVPVARFGVIWRILLLVLFLVLGYATWITTKSTQPQGTRIWTFVLAFFGAVGTVVTISSVFNPTAEIILTALKQISNRTDQTAKNVDSINSWLHDKFPNHPPILDEIGGRWGEVEPACAVVWNIEIVQRGDKAAVIAETVKWPSGNPPYRFVGSITSIDQTDPNTLHVVGVEPEQARGWAADFSYDPTTQRLEWLDVARGSAGKQLLKRCP